MEGGLFEKPKEIIGGDILFLLACDFTEKASQGKLPKHPWDVVGMLKHITIYRRIHFCRLLKKNTLKSVSSQKSSSTRWKIKHMIIPISFQAEIIKVKIGLGWLCWLTTQHLIFTLAELYFLLGKPYTLAITFTGIWTPVQPSHENVVNAAHCIDEYLESGYVI